MHEYLAAVWPISSALIISLLLEFTVASDGKNRSKPALAIVLHMLIFSAFYLLFFLLCRRLIFSGILVILGQLVLVVISNAKYKALREPLVASDLILFTQALRHPRLYFPFLGLVPAIALPLALIGSVYLMTWLEPPRVSGEALLNNLPMMMLVGGMVAVLIAFTAYLIKPAIHPGSDVARYGLIANLAVYIVHTLTSKTSIDDGPLPFSEIHIDPDQPRPHIVVVQSESFFDVRPLSADIKTDVLVRPLSADIKTDVLKNYDQCRLDSAYSGTLDVPAWGAYTMRTEFAFLTGLASQDLKFSKFDPYQAFKTRRMAPNSAEFFSRDKVFPNLGFQQFIDIDSFDERQKFGPYIGDQAVTEKICGLLNDAKQPLFIFAITMENHGPLHLETPIAEDVDRFYSSPPPESFNDLTVYLRHLANADAMIGQLRDYFTNSEQEVCFCWYGDHVPSMPDVYDHIGFNDSHTNYLIWSKVENPATNQPLAVESLGKLLLSCALPETETASEQQETLTQSAP
jgi:hypothetical protein